MWGLIGVGSRVSGSSGGEGRVRVGLSGLEKAGSLGSAMNNRSRPLQW